MIEWIFLEKNKKLFFKNWNENENEMFHHSIYSTKPQQIGNLSRKKKFYKIWKKMTKIWWFGQIAKKSPNIWPNFGQNNNIFWWNLVKFLAKKFSIFFGQNFWRFWASLMIFVNNWIWYLNNNINWCFWLNIKKCVIQVSKFWYF